MPNPTSPTPTIPASPRFLVGFGWNDPAYDVPDFRIFEIEALSWTHAYDKACILLDDRSWLHENLFDTDFEEVLEYTIGHHYVWALDALDSSFDILKLLTEGKHV